MNFGLNETPAIDLLREELLNLLELVKYGTLDYTRAKIPFSVLLPDFVVNQPALTEEHLRSIAVLAEVLLTHRSIEIDMVIGRASQTGSESNNLSLSEARARAVVDELARLQVYPPPTAVGLGSTKPIQDIPNVESELNRSVEIALWYELSPAASDDHPAEYWRTYIRERRYESDEQIIEWLYDIDIDTWSTKYDRAALIVQLVYDNIDDLYLPQHDITTPALNAMTAWQDDGLVRARNLLGYYKQTGSSAQEILADIEAFNKLLRDNGLTFDDFTGEEISDAEHFVTAAVLTMVPGMGLLLGPYLSFLWEGGQSSYQMINPGPPQPLKYNMGQLIGADFPGVAYGMMRTYGLP